MFKKNDVVTVIDRVPSWMHGLDMTITDISDYQNRPIYFCEAESGIADWFFAEEISLTDEA